MNKEVFQELIDLIKKERKNKGISQSGMAEKINISQPSYTRFEKGQGNPSIEHLIKICKVLDISIHYVLRKIYTDSDPEFISLQNEKIILEKKTQRREAYIKLLKYNISEAIREIEKFKNDKIDLNELHLKLDSLKITLETISEHEIPA